MVSDFGAEVAVDRNEAVVVGCEEFAVDSWFEIEACEVGFRAEIEEVLVSGVVFGEEYEVVSAVARAGVCAVCA